MKVFSLYYKDEFVASFPTKESGINYAKKFYPAYDDAYECNIVEEYLSKSPIVYTPPHYTSLHSMPCKDSGITLTPPPVISKPPARYPDSYPEIYCDGGVRAE